MQEMEENKGFKQILNIDLNRYCQNPTESETIKIFSKVINTIYMVEPDTPRTLPNICKEANHIFTMLNSQFKILYAQLLQPDETVMLGIQFLTLHAYRLQQQLLEPNNIHTEAKDLIGRIESLKQRQMAAKIKKEQIKEGKRLIALKHLKEKTDIMIQENKKKLASIKCKHQDLEATLHEIQHNKDIKEVQLNCLKDKNEALVNELKLESSNYNICLDIGRKKIALEELTRKFEALQGAMKDGQLNIDSSIYDKNVKTLKLLVDLIDGELCELEATGELANSFDNTEKKLHDVKQQLKEIESNKVQIDKKCQQERDANNKIQKEILKSQELISGLRRRVFNMFEAVAAVKENIKQIEDTVRENTKQFHVFNESCSNQCTELQKALFERQ